MQILTVYVHSYLYCGTHPAFSKKCSYGYLSDLKKLIAPLPLPLPPLLLLLPPPLGMAGMAISSIQSSLSVCEMGEKDEVLWKRSSRGATQTLIVGGTYSIAHVSKYFPSAEISSPPSEYKCIYAHTYIHTQQKKVTNISYIVSTSKHTHTF